MSKGPDTETLAGILVVFMIVVVTFLLVLGLRAAHSRDGGNWSAVDPETRQWIASVKMPDVPATSCCGEADLYEADRGDVVDGINYAIVTNNRGNPLPVGTRLAIPPNKIQNKQGNPTGHVLIFANTSGVVYCFVPNGGM